jgi:very-short-patch-repair endonuclease
LDQEGGLVEIAPPSKGEPIFAANRFEGHTGRPRQVMDALTLHGTESPIEAVLLEALERMPLPAGVEIKRQIQIGRYRVDFLMGRRLANGQADCLAVIECDGRKYHEIENDYARDRFLQTHGAAVLRFTGSEIQRNAAGCATEILEWFDAAIRRRERP